MFGRRSRRMSTLSAIVAASLLALSACGSDGSSSGGGSGSVDQSSIDASKKLVAEESKVPTTIPVTTPLKSKPTPGKTFVFLQCEIASCGLQKEGAAAAAKAVGWNLKVIPFQTADPATLVKAMNQALQYDPVAVAVTSLPYETWQSMVPVYKKAGVIITPAYIGPAPISETVPTNVGGPDDYAARGKVLANWVNADSENTGQVLLYNVPAYAILKSFTGEFTKTLNSICSSCKITPLDASISDQGSGKASSLIIAALKRNPKIKYVIGPDGSFLGGLSSALAPAGLSGKVKIAGTGGNTSNEAGVLAGKESAWEGIPAVYAGWMMVDAALRHAEGSPISPAENGILPRQLLTKASMTAGNIKPSDAYEYPADYPDQLKKLWKVQ